MKPPNPACVTHRSPVDQLEAGRAFFSGLDLEVAHFAALWHSFKVGERLTSDLNAIAARNGLSIADFHLLGALMVDRPTPLRATDLALTLQVSNGAMSARINRLAEQGFVIRSASTTDQRARLLELTEAGARMVHEIGAAIEQESRFIRHFSRLTEADQNALGRIMGQLHTQMSRDFLPVSRPKV